MHSFGSIQHTKWRIAISLCLLACLPATAQTVENVRTTFDQSTQLMVIQYDLKGLSYKKEIKITPYIESNDAAIKSMQSLSGDFGWVNRGGKNKVIMWDPFKDGINSLEGIQIKITASEVRNAEVPRFRGLVLHGSNSAPLGIKYMQLGKVGFYTAFRMGKFPPSYIYTVSDAGEINYPSSGVYQIGSEKRLAGYAFTAGPTIRVARNAYMYVGAGYGVEQLFWKYQAYDLDKSLVGSGWALNESINRKGITMDAGVVIRRGRLLIDLGGSSIQFKSLQITAGVGLAFSKNKKL